MVSYIQTNMRKLNIDKEDNIQTLRMSTIYIPKTSSYRKAAKIYDKP